MSKNQTKRRRIKRSIATIALIGLVVLLSYWYYYSYYLAPNESIVTSTTSNHSSSSIAVVLKQSDFNLTNSNGCEFVNQTSGQTELLFILYVTNRFNMPVHYVNESANGFLISAPSGNQLAPIPFSVSLKSSHYTDRLILFLTFPVNLIPTGGTPLTLSVFVATYTPEANGTILLTSEISLSQTYPACSS